MPIPHTLIRPAQTDDIPALLALLARTVPLMRASGNLQWDETYPNRQVFERDIERGQLWVAELESDVAAVAAFTRDQEPEYAQVGWDLNESAIVVHRLAVDPAHRGAGLARGLMLHAEQVARAGGIGVMRVDTNTQNPATQRLLPQLGYTPAGEIGLSYRPGLRFLCYEKRLDKSVLDKPTKASTSRDASLKGTASEPVLSGVERMPQNASGDRRALAPEGNSNLAAIALGSNLESSFGDREANLREAIERIRALGHVRAVSSFYLTAPVGYTDQPDFLNAALLLETELAPLDLMHALLAIERAMGRDRALAPPKGPRIIDLDLLLIGDLVLATPNLTLPHPAMCERRFVLEPLAEIAPAMIDPRSGHTIAEMLNALP